MEVVIGTYEEHLVGFLLQKKEKDGDTTYSLKQSFTNKAHEGSIRSVAHSWKYLVSGGVDEVVHIISMKHRIDAGTLVGAHNGTITALEFLRSAYLFTGSDDGTIAIWNSRKGWALEKVLRGHREGVTSLSVHASGKLLLSVSARDRTLRTWNLVKGRCAYVINLKSAGRSSQAPQQVVWSTTGAYFAVLFEHAVDVYDLGTGGVCHSIEKTADPFFEKRLNKVLFADDNTLFICGDSPEVVVYDLKEGKVVNRVELHANRIKDMALVEVKTMHPDLKDETMLPNELWLVTASSDGFIRITSYDGDNLSAEPRSVAQVNSTCRPTCLTVWTSSQDSKFDNFVVPKLKLPREMIAEVRDRFTKSRQMFGKIIGKTDDGEGDEVSPYRATLSAKMAAKRQAAGGTADRRSVGNLPKESEALTSSAFAAAAASYSSSSEPARKKVKTSENLDNEEEEEVEKEDYKEEGDDDSEDDEEAIRQMKADSKVLKEMNKYRKGKKKNHLKK